MHLLGRLHRDGEGVARSRQRARYWFTQATKAFSDKDETAIEARSALEEMQ
jgi:TPR repeat protein